MSLMVGFWRAKEAGNRAFLNKHRARLLTGRLQSAVNGLEGVQAEDRHLQALAALLKEAHALAERWQKSSFRWGALFLAEDCAAVQALTDRLAALALLMGLPADEEPDKSRAEDEESLKADLSSAKQLMQAARASIGAEDLAAIRRNAAALCAHLADRASLGAFLLELRDSVSAEAPADALAVSLASVRVSESAVAQAGAGEDEDRAALSDFCLSTRLDIAHGSWRSERPLRDWYGVFADEGGRVSGLSLWACGLAGPLPPSLGRLGRLASLWLPSNRISGAIPSELGRLLELTALDLSDNALSGPVPDALFGLSKLTYLDLSSNRLTGPLSPEVGKLVALTKLDLRGNTLSGSIPAELGALSSLVDLDLSANNFTGAVPIELGGLHSLTRLRLQGEQLFSMGQVGLSTGGKLRSHRKQGR